MHKRTIKYAGRNTFTRIKELTPYVIELGYKHQKIHPGGFFTTTAISNLDYRKRNPENSFITANINFKKKIVKIIFSDAWTRTTELEVPFYFRKDLIKFFESAIKEELLKEDFKDTIKRTIFTHNRKEVKNKHGKENLDSRTTQEVQRIYA